MKGKINVPFVIALSVILIAAGVLAWHFIAQDKALEKRTEEAMKVETVIPTRSDLVGNYSMKMESGEIVTNATAYIDVDDLGNCVLHILSEYEPRALKIEINEDGTLYNEELGLGNMTRKPSIDKTSIKFVKEDLTCEFTR